MTTKESLAAESYAEQFKTGEWFERIRIESFLAGVEYHKKQPSIGLLPPSEEHLLNEAIGDVIKISTLNKYSVARKLIKDQFYVISKEDAVKAHHSPKSILEYNGFKAEVSVSFTDNILHGKLIDISDLVNFEAESIDKIKEAFREAVDYYVLTLLEINQNK